MLWHDCYTKQFHKANMPRIEIKKKKKNKTARGGIGEWMQMILKRKKKNNNGEIHESDFNAIQVYNFLFSTSKFVFWNVICVWVGWGSTCNECLSLFAYLSLFFLGLLLGYTKISWFKNERFQFSNAIIIHLLIFCVKFFVYKKKGGWI